MSTDETNPLRNIGKLLSGVTTVFAFLAVIDIGLLFALFRIVPNITADWCDPRLWLTMLIMVLLIASVISVIYFMKTDPSILGEPQPTLEDVDISGSEIVDNDD